MTWDNITFFSNHLENPSFRRDCKINLDGSAMDLPSNRYVIS